MHSKQYNASLRSVRLLALVALALGACAAPAAVPPTSAPTQAATDTAPAPTPAATAQRTAAPANIPVPATSVNLVNPYDVVVDSQGILYVPQCGGGMGPSGGGVLKIDSFGQMSVYLSPRSDGFVGDGGPATDADISCPAGLVFGPQGNLYVADSNNNRIRRIDQNGIISTVAGGGPASITGNSGGFSGDGGPATSALLQNPGDIAFDATGNLYLVDSANNRIRKVDQHGLITTVAGNGATGFAGDGGPATAAEIDLSRPSWTGIAVDAQGNLYIADYGNARVRKVDQQGIITTFAGDGGPALAGDGGPAINATLAGPTGLAFDASGNLYVATIPFGVIVGNCIRKVDRNGIISTVAGTSLSGYSGDNGPATAAELRNPLGLAFDNDGNLYIVDNGNGAVRKVDKNGTITTVAGGHF